MELLERRSKNVKNDILSGLTVALALVPEAVAFAFVAGVDPLVGLYAAFMVGFVTSILGGRPGMISGATGALAVVMVSLVKEGNEMGLNWANPVENAGLYYLFATVILMGMIQILCGLFKLGKFVRLIPHPVMMGFVNGLAIVIFVAQLGMFTHVVDGQKVWLEGAELWIMITMVISTMAIIYFLPKLTKKIPAGLVAILTITLIAIFGGFDVATVGSFVRDSGGDGIKGGLPVPQLDALMSLPFSIGTLKFIFPYALILAAIGLIESLMTLNLIDEITDTRGNANKECVAQGTANVLTGIFGGMGGCAMIGQSIINIQNGGRGRLSGIVASLALLSFILFGSSYIEMVPISALVGVMFMVVIGTFEWSTFKVIHKIPSTDAIVIVLVTLLTVIFDLAVAVGAGVVVSAIVFAWESAKRIRARKTVKEDGTKVYEIWGPLFFGSTTTFIQKFDVKGDPDRIEIDFIESKISDQSAVEALSSLVGKYESQGKVVVLKHLSDDCKRLLIKADPHLSTVIENSVEDPRYYVVTDVMAEA
ncbi:SulP family inorganic anion transporter [Halosquirtibacter laminarini]|uniref:SulP family inorganic anion transporter n=1 Tax=Halosquirtibacter laminarini TaxID=3374600 RepID=A0AC61NRA0_9BACT|nr:SulP family inorganic anion transporter [Prolixibacteraceae bacterium]